MFETVGGVVLFTAHHPALHGNKLRALTRRMWPVPEEERWEVTPRPPGVP